jgi:hypothetical protein
VLAVTLCGLSFSDIERELMQARRASVTQDMPLENVLGEVVRSGVEPLSRGTRGQIAMRLTEARRLCVKSIGICSRMARWGLQVLSPRLRLRFPNKDPRLDQMPRWR